MHNITCLIHLYYPGSWELIRNKCRAVLDNATYTIITACYDDVISEIGSPDNTVIFKVPNKGKDIGGKLTALSYYLGFCDKTKYLAFLHDKISPQTINAEYWSDQLYSLFEEIKLRKVLHALDENPKAGIIGSATFLKNEYIPSKSMFDTTNNDRLKQLILKYNLHCSSYDFIAGTMFMAKSRIFEDFFSAHSPLTARKDLEAGNVLDLNQGTYTHSWERLFCFIANHQGYEIKGIA